MAAHPAIISCICRCSCRCYWWGLGAPNEGCRPRTYSPHARRPDPRCQGGRCPDRWGPCSARSCSLARLDCSSCLVHLQVQLLLLLLLLGTLCTHPELLLARPLPRQVGFLLWQVLPLARLCCPPPPAVLRHVMLARVAGQLTRARLLGRDLTQRFWFATYLPITALHTGNYGQ